MSQPRLEIVKDEPDDLRAKLRKVIVHRDELLAKAADEQPPSTDRRPCCARPPSTRSQNWFTAARCRNTSCSRTPPP